MSDEASGPEDDSEETKEAWKDRIAAKAGLGASKELGKLKFLEVIEPRWRSEEVSLLTSS